MRNTAHTRKMSGTGAAQKEPLMKRMIVNKIRPRLTRPRYTDDDTLRLIVTKTYIEEGTPMSIIEDDFLHFAIRAGEIWMEPQEGFVRKKTAKKTAAKRTKKLAVSKVPVAKKSAKKK